MEQEQKRKVGRPRKDSTHPLDVAKRQQRNTETFIPSQQAAVDLQSSPDGVAVANRQATSRLRLGELGTEGMTVIRDITNTLMPVELKWPTCLRTYEKMKFDSAVSSALDLKYILIEKRFSKAEVRFNKESEASKQAAAFIEWCFNNMDGQTLRSVARNAATFAEHGFSMLEKVYTRVTEGDYAGKYKISKLGYRHPLSLYQSKPFKFEDEGRKFTGVYQDPRFFKDSVGLDQTGVNTRSEPLFIPRNKLIWMGYNVTDSVPAGASPFNAVYKAWREKVILEDLEVTGASKDLSGKVSARR